MRSSAFSVRDRVRWSDVDQAGIVYFGAFVRFIEVAETELFREIGFPYRDVFDRFDMWLPRVHLDFNFFAPARLEDELTMTVHVQKVGTSSLRLLVDVFDEQTQRSIAEATIVAACVDRTSLKSRRLPEEFASALRARVATA